MIHIVDTIEIAQTAKLRLYTNKAINQLFMETAKQYAGACSYVSCEMFESKHITSATEMQDHMYYAVREKFGLRSQMTCSVFKTVAARYKTIESQMENRPYRVTVEENGRKKTYVFQRDLTWLQKPVIFSRPQADLVRNRDYSFVKDEYGDNMLSINTINGRVRVKYTDKSFEHLLCDGWKLGTAKLVEMNGIWYLHIGCTKIVPATSPEQIRHIVGNDRGLRFLLTSFDDNGKTTFHDGKRIRKKRDKYNRVRESLQRKGSKGAKRVLKRIAGRENRWMADVNHCLSKTLSECFQEPTLLVLEDLTGVSFDDKNLHGGKQANSLRSWSFYDLEQKIRYKAEEKGHIVLIVPAHYTSQRCPICGQIRKANRKPGKHEYVCSKCGYTSNDDRIASMNLFDLGAAWLEEPEYIPYFEKPLAKKKVSIM